MLQTICLKKGEDRRIRQGHPWIFSNEIDTAKTPIKSILPGTEVVVISHDSSFLGKAYLNPNTLIAARLYSYQKNQSMDEAFFIQRIKQAQNLRQLFYEQPYYRLVFSEGDALPGLIIDQFANDFIVQINTSGMENKKEEIRQALLALFPHVNSILLRNESSARLREGLALYTEQLYGNTPEFINMIENDVKFTVPLHKGQKTGWFYDQRNNHARLKPYVKDQSVLDVFSYLGGFGVTAAHYGAKKVCCIESSTYASQLIQTNAILNQCDDRIEIITDDAFDALNSLQSLGKRYDVIILDPPAFVKKRKDLKNGLAAYQRINQAALKLLDNNGILISCSCSMHVSLSDLIDVLKRACFRTQKSLQIVEIGHQAPDHPLHLHLPESDYLKAVFARVIDHS